MRYILIGDRLIGPDETIIELDSETFDILTM